MSLINDALNRARAEALRRESEERGEAPVPIAGPERSLRLPPAVWGVVAAILLVVVWFWLRGTPSKLASGQRTLGKEVAGLVAPDTAPPARSVSPANEDRDSGTPEEATPAHAEAVRGVAAAPVDTPAPARAPAPVQPLAADDSPANGGRPPAPSTSESPAAVWPATGDEPEIWYYVGQVAVPGGGVVELGGIAWSEAAPSAMLNGSLLSVGDEILGLRVAAIAPRTVTLTGRGQRIALQVGTSSEP